MTENLESAQIAKRRRVTEACDFCRSRKSKCGGGSPSCAACRAHGVVCSYATPRKKRGQPAGYTSDLMRQVAMYEAVLGVLLSTDRFPTDVIAEVLETNCIKLRGNSNVLQSIWRQSKAHHIFIKVMAGTHDSQTSPQSTDQSNERPVSQEHSPSTIDQVAQFRMSDHAPSGPIERFDTSDTTDNAYEVVQDSYPRSGTNQTSDLQAERNCQDVSILLGPSTECKPRDPHLLHLLRSSCRPSVPNNDTAPADDTAKILDHYFIGFHSCLPIIDKLDLLRLYHQTCEPTSAHRMSELACREDRALLLLVRALASHDAFSQRRRTQFQAIRDELYYEIMDLLSTHRLETPISSHMMQVFVAFIVYLVQDEYWTAARQILSILRDLIIRKGCSRPEAHGESLDTRSKERILATAVAVDILVAARLGCPTHFQVNETKKLTLDESGLEEWDSWMYEGPEIIRKAPARVVSTFNHFMDLVLLFRSLLARVRSTKEDGDSTGHADEIILASYVLHTIMPILSAWYGGLPDHLAIDCSYMPNTHVVSVPTPHSKNTPPHYILNIHIAYHAFTCFLIKMCFYETHRQASKDYFVVASLLGAYTNSLKIINRLLETFNQTYTDVFCPFVGAYIDFASLSKEVEDVMTPYSHDHTGDQLRVALAQLNSISNEFHGVSDTDTLRMAKARGTDHTTDCLGTDNGAAQNHTFSGDRYLGSKTEERSFLHQPPIQGSSGVNDHRHSSLTDGENLYQDLYHNPQVTTNASNLQVEHEQEGFSLTPASNFTEIFTAYDAGRYQQFFDNLGFTGENLTIPGAWESSGHDVYGSVTHSSEGHYVSSAMDNIDQVMPASFSNTLHQQPVGLHEGGEDPDTAGSIDTSV